ncbi:hypothetical protein HNQ93_003057 [Hymenobacter luteus]|uniref:Thioredoxin family protein n=2 Tax=Hymenobacter TaxID=89966 RepID=A0A7W9T2E9_9BACT|nr:MULTISPECIES: hypothetical protein [Hymenobacter]MBB4602299.1 hypothetical protein [Hymenobacter latericoloratus]MBB6060191.1 hypothetical protein [Hymenobacter luteus]
MKKPGYWLLFLFLSLLVHAAPAQQLRFEKDSLDNVLKKARKLQKPVFLLLIAPPPQSGLSKEKQEQFYGTGLDDASVAPVLQREFLLVQASFNTPEGKRTARRYHVSAYPTYLYLHPDGTVLHRSFGNTRDPQRYLRDFDVFRRKLADPANLSQLEQRYAAGEREARFLRQYIQARRSVGAPISPALLDAYVGELPVKAFDQFAEVLFVHECGPVVDSRAYKLARLNKRLVDSMYAVLPLAQRVAFNNLIINNTMQAAIATRDQGLAQQGANFARGSWSGKDFTRGMRTYEQNMLRYYQALRDTTHYLPLLISFYERHYMATPADTIRRQRAAQQALRSFQQPTPYPNLARPDLGATVVRMVPAVRGGVDTYALDLNNGAWTVYTSGTRRTSYLTQAMRWSQRTIDLDPRAAYYDTLAHLLYALRLYTEAEATQQKAIAQAKKENLPGADFQQVLRKIKTRTL